MWGSSSTKRRCRGEATGRSRSEEAGDRRPVPAQVEQQPAHVGGGLDEDDEQGVGVENRNDGDSLAEFQHGGAEIAAAARAAELGHAVDHPGEQGSDAFAVPAITHAGIASETAAPAHPPSAHPGTTVTRWALDGPARSWPSGYQIATKTTIRTDRSSSFDFAFDVDTLGRPVFLPTGALGLGVGSGLQHTSAAFDAITAPSGSDYTSDSAFVFDTGNVALARSRPGCSLGASIFYYAKLKVLAYDPVARRVDFEILVNANCGYRSLKPGVPTS